MTATIAATMTSREKADSSLVVSAALTEGRMAFASLGIMVLYYDASDGLMRKPMLGREPLMIPDRRMPPKLAANVRKVNLIAPAGLLERIDHYRRHLSNLPNRSEVIRSLIEMSLDAVEGGAKPVKPKPKG